MKMCATKRKGHAIIHAAPPLVKRTVVKSPKNFLDNIIPTKLLFRIILYVVLISLFYYYLID